MFKQLFGFINSSNTATHQNDPALAGKIKKPEEKGVNKGDEIYPSSHQPIEVSPDIIDYLVPLNILDREERLGFIQDKTTLSMGQGSVVFKQGEPINSLYYLLEGTISLYIYDEKICEINSVKADVWFPLCSGNHYSVSAYAMTDIQVLRVSPDVMLNYYSYDINPFDPADPHIPTEVRESKLFKAFCQVYSNGELQIPTLPSIIFQLRQALQSKDVGINEVAEIIQMDPAIAGKLVQISNSVLYNPWTSFTNCKDAILHIGLTATRNFVFIESLRHVFYCDNSQINELLKEEWTKSIYLSCLCWVLASENGGINPEEAQLAGLVSEIGNIPFFTSLVNIEKEYISADEISLVLPYIGPKIGVEVLKSWGFSDELVKIPLLAENWFNDTSPQLKVSDIVILSKLHAYIGTPKMPSLPPINSIPAFGKLKDCHLCPDNPVYYSLNVLNSAKNKVSMAENLLRL